MPVITLDRFSSLLRTFGVSIAVWFGFSLLTGLQYCIINRQSGLHSAFVAILILAQAKAVAFALLTPMIFGIVSRYPVELSRRCRYFISYGIGVLPFVAFCSGIEWLFLHCWDGRLQHYILLPHHPSELADRGFADQMLVYCAIVGIAHAYKYYQRDSRHEVEKRQFQSALAATELKVLKMQLRPHFLFNTLHGISTLIDEDSGSAKTMVIKVSSLLRRALEQRNSDLVPLKEEIKFVQDYLDLEKMRFGDRLTVNWSVDREIEQTLVPELILQPLVENAIRHGIATSREQGWIEITANRHDDNITVLVRNSSGTKESPHGTGLGLKNTAARIRTLYSDTARFSFEKPPMGIATATLTLPAEFRKCCRSESLTPQTT
jgi:two-component system, LytTR family, sensor kinase